MATTQIAAVTAMLVLAAGTAPAADTCKGGPKNQWRSVQDVKQAAIDRGFTQVAKVILEDGCYEVVTVNTDDKIVGVQFDPVTLELAKVEPPR